MAKKKVTTTETAYDKEYVVVNCNRLNVRDEPSLNASINFVITTGTRVFVDTETKIDSWYKVKVNKFGEGYAMKNYLTPIIT